MKFYCVLSKCPNGHYDKDYVDKLYDSFIKFSGLESSDFVCLSNVSDVVGYKELKYNFGGWWSKMELFRPDIDDDIFYVDLDTVIHKDFSDLIDLAKNSDKPIMLEDLLYKNRLASGVMYIPNKYKSIVWDKWIESPEKWMTMYKIGGDQAFIETVYSGLADKWQDITSKICSYKFGIKRGVDPNTVSIICYHGLPRPRSVNWSIN